MAEKIIRNLRDVAEVAKKLFPCGLKRIDETHDKGYMGVKLIVGVKPNPVFEANADPNKPGLTVEQRKIEETKANPQAADIRIVWIRPGMTANELMEEWLIPIKKSLEKVPPIMQKVKETKQKEEKTDLELAQQLQKGEDPETELSDFDDETEDIGMDEEMLADEPDEVLREKSEMTEEKSGDDGFESRVLGAIESLAKNMNTLAEDVSTLNDTVINIDNRVGAFEGKEPKSKLGRPKKK